MKGKMDYRKVPVNTAFCKFASAKYDYLKPPVLRCIVVLVVVPAVPCIPLRCWPQKIIRIVPQPPHPGTSGPMGGGSHAWRSKRPPEQFWKTKRTVSIPIITKSN